MRCPVVNSKVFGQKRWVPLPINENRWVPRNIGAPVDKVTGSLKSRWKKEVNVALVRYICVPIFFLSKELLHIYLENVCAWPQNKAKSFVLNALGFYACLTSYFLLLITDFGTLYLYLYLFFFQLYILSSFHLRINNPHFLNHFLLFKKVWLMLKGLLHSLTSKSR